MKTPNIETDRLIIRSAQEEDIPWVIDLEHQPDNAPYIWLGSYEDHEDEIYSNNMILYVFETKDGGERVGYALVQLDHKVSSYLLRRIATKKKGRGYGEEATRALMADCFDRMERNRFWLDVFPDNTAGIALYEKLGMVKEGVLRENDRPERGFRDQIVYGMLKREWDELKEKAEK